MEKPAGVILGDLIKPARIKLKLEGADRDAVLRELVDLIPETQESEQARDRLLKALRDREELHSTGIGDGVALPHARNALVGLVNDPVIVFGRHSSGIPYAAVDGKPAQLFFLIVAPSVTSHLAVLARLSRVLHDPKLRQQLLKAETVAGVIEMVLAAELKMYS
jgi:mannitol/fructose-specific phosphotransferase system IIA component (Ntr-type)